MNALSTALRELFGLFVDEGSLAVAILVTVALSALLLPVLPLTETTRALIMLAALLAVLVENVSRATRRPTRAAAKDRATNTVTDSSQ